MNIEIKKLVDWDEVYRSALFTQGKRPSKPFPSSKWKLKTCYAQHSVLRDLLFSIEIEDIESFIISHLIRHKKEYTQPYVRTLREDLTGIPSDKITRNTLNSVRFVLNAKSIIDITRVRDCKKASKKTVDVWGFVIDELCAIEPELASVCVAQCVERGFCSEYKTCGYDSSDKFKKERCDFIENCIKNNR